MDGSSAHTQTIRVVCGPTAAGKTFAATWFAQHTPLAVVSADSRQLYRGFDVGTAKPGRDVRDAIPHYGIDALDPSERASAAWWADRSDAWIDDVVSRPLAPLVVGGTGLYLKALFGTLFHEPVLHAGDRAAIQSALSSHSTAELRRWVAQLDPARSHLGRTQLLRVVEIALLTGRRLSDLHRENARPPRRRARYLVIDPGPILANIIAERTRSMLASGWIDEVRDRMADTADEAPAWNATGYRTIRALIGGQLTLEEAEERIVIETRQYAKRQRTWFRHQLADEDVTRLSTNQQDWAERAMAWWREGDE